eukprot:evm.model.scf_1884.1 EVM.evm.TU.scf_1884.1   scf_1884:25738-29505(-)
MTDQYEHFEKIGEGTYGKVFKARDKHNKDRIVALKKTRLEMEEEGVPSTALREISILQTLSKSNHVVKLLAIDYCKENSKPCLYLVFEFLTMDLKKYMDRLGKGPAHPLPRRTIKILIYQLLKGLAFCHAHGIMHRDLKPQNLLIHVDEDVEKGIEKQPPLLKIADLGLGRSFSVPIKSYTHEIVTLWYRAPEVLLGCTHYSLAVDIWSVGCILAELYKKGPLFPGDSELQQLLFIFQILGTPTESAWPGVSCLRDWHEFPKWQPQDLNKTIPELDPLAIDLLKQMLRYDPSTRISALDALDHQYFDDLNKAEIDAMENLKIAPQKPIAHPGHQAKRMAFGEMHDMKENLYTMN